MGSLTQEQVAQFEEEGYLLVRGLFDPGEDLDPIIDEYKGVLDHCPTDIGLGIPGKLLGGSKAVPMSMQRGDALFMHRLTVHASFSNTSDEVRWSFDLRYNPIGQPTGRSAFPGFVARSHQRPETELRDAEAWGTLWRNTRDHLAAVEMGKFNRWDKESPACA